MWDRESDDEQISWKSSDEEDDEVALNDDDDDNDDDVDNNDDNNDADNQDNDGQEYDEHDDEEQGDDDKQTDSDNDGDDFVHPNFSTHDEEDKEEDRFVPRMNEEEINEEAEVDALYRDLNVNLEGSKTMMTDASLLIVQPTQEIEDTHVIINSGLKTLETDFSEFKQTNQFAVAVSLIPGIIDAYLANKMHETVKTVVHLQSERLRDEAQAENVDFLNKLDDNIKKIIKDQVKEQVKDKVSKILPKIKKTTANLSELELKKILIDKMESNKSIHISEEQKNLYKALIDAYENDKLILDTYGATISFKRHRDDEDKDEQPFAGSNRGSKRKRAGKEQSIPVHKGGKTSNTMEVN
ncbi:hypothetical protein Tco_0127713 [Tanacetum coccineum]